MNPNKNKNNGSNLTSQPGGVMSTENGFSKEEKQILEALEQSPKGYMALRDVLRARFTGAEYEAIEGACWCLWRKGLIDAYRSSEQFGIRVAIALPGVNVPDLNFLIEE